MRISDWSSDVCASDLEPDTTVSAREAFGLSIDMQVPAFSEPSEYVPNRDDAYLFDHDTTLAILAGFARNRRVMIPGYPVPGHSTPLPQEASRLHGPCIRVHLDTPLKIARTTRKARVCQNQ